MTGSVGVVLPLACLASGAFGVYLLARFVTRRNDLLALFTAGIFGVALGALVLLWPVVLDRSPEWGSAAPGGVVFRASHGAMVMGGVALGLGLSVAVYSGRYLALDRRYETYYPLLLLMAVGVVGMLLATDLFNLYMFCELMSITAYVLVAFRRRTQTAIEAGFKYLVMSSVGTVTILLGIAFVYRETGSTALVQGSGSPGPWARAGVGCLLAGLGLKSALVPLHTWLPDAHGRAPSSISAMLSGIIVQNTFYALLRVCLGLGVPAADLGRLLIILSLANMVVGNGMALVQVHTKRLLAYSTIAQMGYLMFSIGVGLRYGLVEAIQAGFLLIISQAVMKGLAFLCKGACHFYRNATTLEQLQGTAAHLPLIAVAFAIALIGLSGLPPLAGFVSKWFVVQGALRASGALAYVGAGTLLLNSVVALGYYLPIIGRLFAPAPPRPFIRPGRSRRYRVSNWIKVPVVALGALTLAIGLYPNPWLTWVGAASEYLLALGR